MTNLKNDVRVSIGLPVYNGERYVEQAIDSILGQTFMDFELIISDNGSTDRTQAICEAYAAQDRRVRYYRYEQNRGAAWNFNNVFELSRTEYFKWQCYDDYIAPQFVEQCVDVLDRESEVVLCYPRTTIVGDEGQVIGLWADNLDLRSSQPHKRLHHYLRNKSRNEAQYGVMRASALAKTGGMGTIRYSDQVLMSELALNGQFRELPEYNFYKRFHSQISTEAYKDPYSFAKFMDTMNRHRVGLPRLKRLIEFMKGVQRANLKPYDRMLCYVELIVLMLNLANVVKMTEDIFGSVLHSLRSLPRGRGAG